LVISNPTLPENTDGYETQIHHALGHDRGIIFVLRNGLRWRDAPKEYGPHKTIYNRFIRWSRLGVFNRILAELTAKRGRPEQLMIDATHLKAHRTAASLLKKGMFPDVSDAPRAG
jgi:transposase